MKIKDYVAIVSLSLLAVAIWFRNTSWMSTSDDTLPILVSLPLYAWLGAPWKWRETHLPVEKRFLLGAAVVGLIGLIFNVTFLLGVSWTLLLWAWLSSSVQPSMVHDLKRLLILPMMAFPWVALDAERLGWWFRLSGATIAEKLFSYGGLPVFREGTSLNINGMQLSVAPACSGMNTLQSMLIAGSVVCFLLLGNSKRYWPNLLLLPLMAWLANTIRVIAICAAGFIVSPEFAMGPFHDYGGWAILFLMFLLCWLLFSLQEEETSPSSSD
jgi:exosortase